MCLENSLLINKNISQPCVKCKTENTCFCVSDLNWLLTSFVLNSNGIKFAMLFGQLKYCNYKLKEESKRLNFQFPQTANNEQYRKCATAKRFGACNRDARAHACRRGKVGEYEYFLNNNFLIFFACAVSRIHSTCFKLCYIF